MHEQSPHDNPRDQPPHDNPREQSPHDNPPDAAPVSPFLSPHRALRTVIPRRLSPRVKRRLRQPRPAERESSSPRAKGQPLEGTSAKAASPRRGRPSILADETKQAEILAIVAGGASLFAAANYVGVHVQTLRRLVRTDKHFRQRLEQADARHEIDMVRRITKASRKQWRAAAWKLERTRPSIYRPHSPDVVTKPGMALIISNCADAIISVIPGHRLRNRVADAMNKVVAAFIAAEDPRRQHAAKKPLSVESWDRLHH